jgi:hypothetical protein
MVPSSSKSLPHLCLFVFFCLTLSVLLSKLHGGLHVFLSQDSCGKEAVACDERPKLQEQVGAFVPLLLLGDFRRFAR